MKKFDEIKDRYKERCIYIHVYEKMRVLNDVQQEKLKEHIAVKEKTEAILESLPETEREILRRYMEGGNSWYQEAGEDMSMSKTTIDRLLKKAVENAEKLYAEI